MTTHNTREIEEDFIRRYYDNEFDGGALEMLDPDLMCAWWATQLHHQLQKARHDWLREEIVRLEGMKAEVSESDSEVWGYSLLEEIGSCCPGDDAANVYEHALQTIIDRYNEELDQDKNV